MCIIYVLYFCTSCALSSSPAKGYNPHPPLSERWCTACPLHLAYCNLFFFSNILFSAIFMYNLRTTYPCRITHFEPLVSRDTNCTFLRKFCTLLHKVKNYPEKNWWIPLFFTRINHSFENLISGSQSEMHVIIICNGRQLSKNIIFVLASNS